MIFSKSTKPVAICETTCPAQTCTINAGSLTINGTAAKQTLYYKNLFDACASFDAKFVIT